MANIARLFEYHIASDIEREKISKQLDPELARLLLTEEIEATDLVLEEVYKTVLDGAEPKKCMREALTIIKTKSNSLRYTMGAAGAYADVVPEGAEIPIKIDTYTKTDFDIKKIGTRPLITRELVEDSLFDVVALELKKAGERIENKLNRDAINEMIGNSSGSLGYYNSSAVGVADIVGAMGTVKVANRNPDTLVITPGFEAMLLKDSNLAYANRAGSTETLRSGSIGNLLGLKCYTLGVTTANTSWDGSSQNGTGAIVFDSTCAAAIAMKRDLSVEKYEDPIRDLEGISVTMRYDCQTLDGAGMCNLSRIDA